MTLRTGEAPLGQQTRDQTGRCAALRRDQAEFLDIAGLVSPDVAPIVDDADALWALMEERDARYLMAFPDQIPGDRVDDARLCRIFITNGETAPLAGGSNMAIYRLAWDEKCES